MGKLDSLFRYSEEDNSGIDLYFFDEGQLLDLDNDNVGEEEDVEHMELEGIDVALWEKKNRVCVVQQEHRLGVLSQHHESQVAGH